MFPKGFIALMVLFEVLTAQAYDYTYKNIVAKGNVCYDVNGSLCNGSYSIKAKIRDEVVRQYGHYVNGLAEGEIYNEHLDGRKHSMYVIKDNKVQIYPQMYHYYPKPNGYYFKQLIAPQVSNEVHYWHYPKALFEKMHSIEDTESREYRELSRQIDALRKYSKRVLNNTETQEYFDKYGRLGRRVSIETLKNKLGLGAKFKHHEVSLKTIVDYFETGGIKQKRSYLNQTHKHGEFLTYNAYGVLVKKELYDAGLAQYHPIKSIHYNLYGKVQEVKTHRDNNITERTYFDYDKKQLASERYHNNNTLVKEVIYYANGNVAEEYNAGTRIYYHPNTQKKVFVQKTSNNHVDSYDVDGELIDDIRHYQYKGKISPIDKNVFQAILTYVERLKNNTLTENKPKQFLDDIYVDKNLIYYKNTLIDGRFSFVNEYGILSEAYNFSKGKLVFIAEFTNLGFVTKEQRFEHNSLVEEKLFSETGLYNHTFYLNGDYHGKRMTYHDNGMLKSEGEYQFSKRVGIHKLYDKYGNKSQESLYENDVLLRVMLVEPSYTKETLYKGDEKESRYFNLESGESSISQYKNGKRVKYEAFYADGTPKPKEDK